MKDTQLEFEVRKSEKEWKEILTQEQFRILRKKGTEPAFTGEYHNNKKEGLYPSSTVSEDFPDHDP